MFKKIRNKIYKILRSSEKYLGTDMIYIAKGSSWLFLSQIVLGLISFLTLLIFSYFLPKEVFGTYRYVLSFVSILAIFALPGINTAINRTIARNFHGSFDIGLKKIADAFEKRATELFKSH